jgi:Domain of unknown function (DUF5753)
LIAGLMRLSLSPPADISPPRPGRATPTRQWPQVTLQAIPYAVGGHPGMAGSFAILQFGDDAPDVAYMETQAADLFLESETDVARFTMIFNNLRALALPPDESAALITSIARDLEA